MSSLPIYHCKNFESLYLGHSYSSVNLTYLPLEVDVCSLQNQFPHTVYVTGIGGDHEERGAVLDGGQTDKG